MLAAAIVLAVPACAEEAADAAPDAVVAADGSGDYKTVQEAINNAPQSLSASDPWTILVTAGVYREVVHIQREKRFVQLAGEGADRTKITYDLNARMLGPDGKEIGTFRTPTVTIDADDFTVQRLAIENSAGPVGQALALRVDGDRVVCRDCTFTGFQDTVFLNRGRQYFEDCTIIGAVDFIFGGATALFQDCRLRCVRDGYITAASTPADAPFGFVFVDCTIVADDGVDKVYLGRPWRAYASTIFLNTRMPAAVLPVGWSNWDKPEREKTVRYAEYGSTGPGARPEERVPWANRLSQDEAQEITVERVLAGKDNWQPQ